MVRGKHFAKGIERYANLKFKIFKTTVSKTVRRRKFDRTTTVTYNNNVHVYHC